MIFPNRVAAPELRPGMGYQGGSHAMLSEVAHMGYAAGSAQGLGSFSANMAANAVQGGYCTQADINLLNSVGATDQDLANLMAGIVTLQQLYASYGVTFDPGQSAAVPPASSQASAPAGQIPPGSTILYTATFNPVKAFVTASTVISDIAAQLPGHKMSMLTNAVQQSGITSNASFSMTIMDSVGHQYIADAQSILDSLLNQYTDNQEITSSLVVVSPGVTASGTPGGSTNPPASDLVAWLENNAIYIGAGVLALVLVNNFTGGKRR